MKYVFLDFDGVLNSVRNAHALGQYAYNENGLDRVALALVDQLCLVSGAELVISSTWRIGNSEDWFRGLFAAYGVKAKVAGRTPELPSRFRGDEVRAWLKGRECSHHVILDDDSDFHPDQPLVKTDAQVGMTHADYDKALALLGCAGQDGTKSRRVMPWTW